METILSVAGKPGLYKLVSRGHMNLIIEALDASHKKMPVFPSDRVTSLVDVAMYTEEDDVPLMKVFVSVRDKEEGKVCSINYKKCGAEELREYFASVLPNFDRDRVHNSDIKKLLQWYDILVNAGITNFEEFVKSADEETEGEDTKEEEK